MIAALSDGKASRTPLGVAALLDVLLLPPVALAAAALPSASAAAFTRQA
jgi:hypothetical protein